MEMLGETKTNIQNIVNKLQVNDFILQTLQSCGVANKDKAEEIAKGVCDRKLVLIEELVRLLN